MDIIKTRETTVGYHCPFCGMPAMNKINIFSMSGNLIKMKCPCGRSELVVQSLKGGRYKITVPCILCPDPHTFTLSSATFFQKDLFSLACKFTATTICYIGKWGKVQAALRRNEEELLEAFAEYEDELDDLDIFGMDEGGDPFEDFDIFGEKGAKKQAYTLHKNDGGDAPAASGALEGGAKDESADSIKTSSYQITSQILDILSQMWETKRIICECRDFDAKIVILDGSVRVECKNCGSRRDIKSTYVADVEYLSSLKALHLDY